MSLVPYADSDDPDQEESTRKQDENGRTQLIQNENESTKQRRVHTSLNVLQSQPIQGDWLCFAFLPIPPESELIGMLKRCQKFLIHHSTIERQSTTSKTVFPILQPHISLTRPILLRKHECEVLLSDVRGAIESFKAQRLKQDTHSNTMLVAFAKFICLPSEEQNRSFWATEVGQGWEIVRRLTDCLDSNLNSKLLARQYYEQARFHTSFAYTDVDKDNQLDYKLKELEERYGQRLRSCKPIPITQVGVTIGSKTHYLDL